METERIANNVFIDDENAVKAGLPKWPALVVAGKRVTERQAAEILIRTDSTLPEFTYAGNDKHHAARLNALFGIGNHNMVASTTEEHQAYWEKVQDLRSRIGKLRLAYLCNNQIVSSWVGGPHGWCNWNGDIFANNYNIGKWPSVRDVAREWGEIAAAFPFLDLRCQLYSGETCEEGEPVVEFVISDGVVVVTAPRGLFTPPVFTPINPAMIFGSTAFEHGISVDELRQKLVMVYGQEVPRL
jgi:hypothetical protein